MNWKAIVASEMVVRWTHVELIKLIMNDDNVATSASKVKVAVMAFNVLNDIGIYTNIIKVLQSN